MKIEHPEVEYEIGTELGVSGSTTAADPRVVLEELFNLLEDYSPVWYTESHRTRALAALFPPRPSVSGRFSRTYSSQYELPENE